jgi:serine phosphatase RsbU (regulator of sigma subunit)
VPTEIATNSIRLEPVAGPATEAIEIEPHGEITIGRSLNCDFTLTNESVSRRHLSVRHRAGHWLISDLGSRHGTTVNGQAVQEDKPVILGEDDLVGIGPYAFRVSLGGRVRHHTATTIADTAGGFGGRVERVSQDEADRLAQHRLDLLMQCAARIHGAASEKHLADAALQSLLAGTGFHHAVLLRPQRGDAEQIEVLGSRHRSGTAMGEVTFSRSLLAEASTGQMARLKGDAQVDRSVSIAELGIDSALCVPVMLGGSVAAYLYLDTRGGPARIEADAAGFCQAIARMCGLALANLKRLDLEVRHQTLEAEMTAAREAQQFIVPSTEGAAGPVRYAMIMRPGFFVAGDLFEVIELAPNRAAVCIGDVTGEGISAAVFMAAAQSHLHGTLRRTDDPADAVNAVNRYLADRSPEDRFVSLWVGVFDGDSRTVRFVDAGHGHCIYRTGDGAPDTLVSEGGIPAGIDASYAYENEERPMLTGDRLVLYSDGLIEQRSGEGEMFGRGRVVETLTPSTNAKDDVDQLIAALTSHAGSDNFHDDTTIASIEVV